MRLKRFVIDDAMTEAHPELSSAERYAILRDDFDRVSKQLESIEPRLEHCRKKLYIASLISIAVKVTGTVPEKISALGIELKEFQREKLTFLLGLVCLYFLVEFIVMLARERYTIWNSQLLAMWLNDFRQQHFIDSTTEKELGRYPAFAGAIWRGLNPIIYFVLPIVVGLYGVIVAIFWPTIPSWLKI